MISGSAFTRSIRTFGTSTTNSRSTVEAKRWQRRSESGCSDRHCTASEKPSAACLRLRRLETGTKLNGPSGPFLFVSEGSFALELLGGGREVGFEAHRGEPLESGVLLLEG